MINYFEIFNSKDEAEKYVNDVYKAYHPAGYGTMLRIDETNNGKWLVTGHRYSSCD